MNTVLLSAQSGTLHSSDNTGIAVNQASSNTTSQVTAFVDEDAGAETRILKGYVPETTVVGNSDATLGEFLSRPIWCSTTPWNHGSSLFIKFHPHDKILENHRVKSKISFYSMIRFDICVKVLINGSKFHYGKLIVAFDPINKHSEMPHNFSTQHNAYDLIRYSQLPHVIVDATDSKGGVLCIPYFYAFPYVQLESFLSGNLGTIYISSMTGLKNTSGFDSPIDVTVYAWAENVSLAMPTNFEYQSGSEYGTGILSTPASTIASASGALSQVPVIGPYAKATSMVAGALGKVARLFGFSRPQIMTDTVLVKPVPSGNLANVDASEAVMKLSQDSKCEVSIDPRITGVTEGDNLSIVSYATRLSYIHTLNFEVDDGHGKYLGGISVGPYLMKKESHDESYHMTPACKVASCYEYWTGSIRFKILINKTAFHQGRIVAVYDPLGVVTEYTNSNICYQRIIDIGKEDEVDMTIGWGNHRRFLSTHTSGGFPTPDDAFDLGASDTPGTQIKSDKNYNGYLSFYVVNGLINSATSASGSTSGNDYGVNLLIFTAMCDDAKFAVPTTQVLDRFHYRPKMLDAQSGDLDNAGEPIVAPIVGKMTPTDDKTFDIYFGESSTSIRQLFKRYVHTRTWKPDRQALSSTMDRGWSFQKLTQKDIPYFTGTYDPAQIGNRGLDIVGMTESGTVKKAYVDLVTTTYLQWFMPTFAAYRGSFRRKYMFVDSGDSTVGVIRGRRVPITTGFWENVVVNANINEAEKFAIDAYPAFRESGNGTACTNTTINSVIEVELPFYSQRLFRSTRKINNKTLDCTTHDVCVTQYSGKNTDNIDHETFMHEWVAAGEDFNLYFFVGCAPMYFYDVINVEYPPDP